MKYESSNISGSKKKRLPDFDSLRIILVSGSLGLWVFGSEVLFRRNPFGKVLEFSSSGVLKFSTSHQFPFVENGYRFTFEGGAVERGVLRF